MKKIYIILCIILCLGICGFGIWYYFAIFKVRLKEKEARLKLAAKNLLERPVHMKFTPSTAKSKETPKRPSEKYPEEILVDDFDVGLTSGIFSQRKNRLGTYQGTWAMRPSYAIITKDDKIRRGNKGRSLVIDYKKEAGWCGWYTLLNEIDITPYNTLSFWVRGEKGGEKFDIGLADQRMQELEIDAAYLGCVTSFIPDGFVTTEWKEVKVPLSRVSSEIDMSRMGSLVFWFKYGGSGRIYVEDVKFKNDPEISKIEDYNAPRAEKDLLHPRSLWVWKIDPVENNRHREQLFRLCRRASISILYQFFPEFTERPEEGYLKNMAEFLRDAHQNELKVEALTGNPVWSLAENHHLLINWIKFFLDYNASRTPEERIDGVSVDVEPYLTKEWELNREKIKSDYIELLKKCRELIDSYQQDFRLGVAIPFFYDQEDGGEFEKKILDLVDYIALMDYFDTPKEIIEHARAHIKLANKANRRVAIGIETQDLVEMKQGKRRNTFKEEGWEEMERRLKKVGEEFYYEPSFEGFAIHCYYSYKLMTRHRNVPTKERPKDVYTIEAHRIRNRITIDGNLNDWPIEPAIKVAEEDNVVYGGVAWRGPDDLSYECYIGWDEDALYFAFDVTDDVVLQFKKGRDIWEGDHVELWLDLDLEGDFNEAVNSNDDFQIGLSPGDFSTLKEEVYIWAPVLPDEARYKERIELASRRTATGYIVEARIPKDVLFIEGFISRVGVEPKPTLGKTTLGLNLEDIKNFKFTKDFKMGVMLDVGDMDRKSKPMKILMSTSKNRIWGDPTTFGYLKLK